VREIEHAQHPKDQREARGDQINPHGNDQAVEKLYKEFTYGYGGHRSSPSSSGPPATQRQKDRDDAIRIWR
jgi:hypothetical protein